MLSKGSAMGEDKRTFRQVCLECWVPPIITAIVGGLCVSVVLPRFQASFENHRAVHQRQLQLMEQTQEHFTVYLSNWARLRELAKLESSRKLSVDEDDRMKSAIKGRNDAKDRLIPTLNIAKLYFGPDVQAKIYKFRGFDDSNRTTRLNELPPLSGWEEHQDDIMRAMKKEVGAL